MLNKIFDLFLEENQHNHSINSIQVIFSKKKEVIFRTKELMNQINHSASQTSHTVLSANYNYSIPETYIFTPNNELEKQTIQLAITGEDGWQGSLYKLAYYEAYNQELCFIFAIQPQESLEQKWLLVQVNTKKQTRFWSVHEESLEKVYYFWAGNINISEPNFNPSSEELINAMRS
ncbi:hypothetical protein [Crocosphaera chwakensis]|uniref:Uncharacterized protein n=1 Tax=Crocosphaera chwakensis CCY0110 TaxID=391612 RepID=A3IYV5_9CHRO|nr:hypothetical protein [Crocosphaera chwakensis]EAZ88330.1 hypothetical protein CY0110_20905 [Crocosphaera chwakensis CCY0110]